MKKHFMCTHAFLNNDAKKAFEDASNSMTDREIFEMMKGKKAEMLGHWRGDEDFFFCHWYAEDEDAIINHLDKVGFNSLMNTLPNEMSIYMTNNKFINTITSIFEKIAINRTRQALAFLSDNELEAMGITRTSLDTGDFYNYKEVANFPAKKISRIKSTKAKAA